MAQVTDVQLREACCESNDAGEEKLRGLLERASKAAVDGLDNLGTSSPAGYACYSGNPKCLQLLVDAGCDVDRAETNHQLTPAMDAAKRDHVDCLRLLMLAGADFAKAQSDGWTPQHWMAQNNAYKSLEFIGDEFDPPEEAIRLLTQPNSSGLTPAQTGSCEASVEKAIERANERAAPAVKSARKR
jgi:ankyrin repeat protein